MGFVRRYWNWFIRFPYRCGYGIHSPSDFFLVTSVVYERLPYYAYEELQKTHFAVSLPHYRKKVNRLLFRLVNYLRPQLLVEVGNESGASFSYMRAAHPSMDSYAIKSENKEYILDKLEEYVHKNHGLDMLHIGHTPYYKEIFERTLSYVSEQSCFIIGCPYQDNEKKEWWKQLQKDDRVSITFDLYDIGLVFFDKKRIKQNYIINFL